MMDEYLETDYTRWICLDAYSTCVKAFVSSCVPYLGIFAQTLRQIRLIFCICAPNIKNITFIDLISNLIY